MQQSNRLSRAASDSRRAKQEAIHSPDVQISSRFAVGETVKGKVQVEGQLEEVQLSKLKEQVKIKTVFRKCATTVRSFSSAPVCSIRDDAS
jgi:hypothetical protein